MFGPRPAGFCSVPSTGTSSSRAASASRKALATACRAVVDGRHQPRLVVHQDQAAAAGVEAIHVQILALGGATLPALGRARRIGEIYD